MKKANEDNDTLLIQRIRDGDTAAFRLVVEKYKDVSFSLACSIVKDEDEAQDMLQEAFLKVFKNIKKFRFDSSFATWLYRIVVNTCLNAKEKDRKHVFEPISETETNEIGENSGLDSLLENERKMYISKALSRLKAEEALLIRLYYLCDLSIAEIKEVTDFSESNIKVILHRGRKICMNCWTR